MKITIFTAVLLSISSLVCGGNGHETSSEPSVQKTKEDVPFLPKKITFGKVHEVTLWDTDLLVDCLIDFDSHKTYPVTAYPPVDAPHSEFFTKMRETLRKAGVDAHCAIKIDSFVGLLGNDIVGIPTRSEDWDPSYQTMEQLKQAVIGYPSAISAGPRAISADDKVPPATWIFRTRSNYGVLQITEIIKKPEGELAFNPRTKDRPRPNGAGIRLRYKLVAQPTDKTKSKD